MVALRAHPFQFLAEPGDAVVDAPLVDLQPGLARAAGADAAGEARQGVVAGGQLGQHVFQLGHLDLQLALAGAGAAGEDVEDELGAVDHPQIGVVGDRADLRGAQFLIEQEQVGAEAQTHEHDLHQLAATEDEAGVDVLAPLDHLGDHLHSGGAGQLDQLGHGLLGLALRAGGDADEDGPVAALVDLADRPLAAELALQGLDQLDAGLGLVGRMHRGEFGPVAAVHLAGDEVHGMEQIGQAVTDREHPHQVEAQTGQVHDVFFVDRAAAEHGVHTAQAAQPAAGCADPGECGDGDAIVIADDHALDLAGAVDEQADLAVQLNGNGGE